MIKKFVILLTLLVLFACKKEKAIRSKESRLIGEYEWVYTKLSPWEIITFEEAENRYGIEITKSSRIVLFKNGNLVDELKLKSLRSKDDEVDTLYYEQYKKEHALAWHSDTLILNDFPYYFAENYFIKK